MRYLVLIFSVLAGLYTTLVMAESGVDAPVISAASGVGASMVRETSSIEILSPAEGDKLPFNPLITMKFNAALEGDDSKIYIFLDGKKIQRMRKSSTEYAFERLKLGAHEFCIKIAYKDNIFTGQQRCVNVNVVSPRFVNYGTPLP